MKKLALFLFAVLAMAVPNYAQTFAGQSGGDIFVVPPYRFCLGIDNGQDGCFIQTGNQVVKFSGQLDFALPSFTVATLPSAAANPGRIYRVTDGTSSTDCTSGGGSTNAVCFSNGTSWNALGGSGGGGGSQITVNGGPNLSSPVNFQNGPTVNGLFISAVNPSGSNVDYQVNGTATEALLPAATAFSDQNFTYGAHTFSLASATSIVFPATANITGLYYQTFVDGAGTTAPQRPKIKLIDGTNMTITCADNSGAGETDCTFTSSATGATAFSSLTAATNSNTGNFIVSGGGWDFTSAVKLIAPIGAGYAPTANGSFGYNSTSNLWAFGQNGSTLTLPQTQASASNQFLTSYTQATGAFTTAQPAFGNLSGSLTCGQTPALTGDTTTSAGSCTTTTAKINGVSYGTGPGTNTVPVVTGTNTTTYETVPNAALANSSITLNGVAISLGASSTTAAANVTLSNLGTPAVNAALTPGADASISLDSLTKRYINAWVSGVLGWTNGSGTADTGLSRDAAGVVDVGNGSAGDKSAQLNAAKVSTGTTGTGSTPTAGAGVHSAFAFGESSGTTPTCQAGLDIIWSSYSASGLQICNNGGSLAPIASLPISLNTQVSGTLQSANGAPLVGTSGSLGGSALTAGNCSTTTVAITGALNTMAVVVTPKASPGNNYYWKGVVTSSGTVTVYICAVTAGTPTAETYSVRVIQ